MNKKYLSIIVIIATLISVSLMILYSNTSYESDYIMVQENENKVLKEKLFAEIENKAKENQLNNKEKINIDNKEEINKKNEVVDDSFSQEQKKNKDQIKNNNINESTVNSQEKNLINEEENLFKVDKEEILTKLSEDEKKNLKKLTKKLSINDYVNIIYSIKNKGELECCLKITAILQSRLSEEDYKEVRVIFEPYINVDLLEKKLASKN